MDNNTHTPGELHTGTLNKCAIMDETSDYLIATTEIKNGLGKEVNEANAAHLTTCWNNHSALVEALREVISHEEQKYNSDCEHANWYNNNMPGVGQTLEYIPLPSYPDHIIKARQLLTSLK